MSAINNSPFRQVIKVISAIADGATNKSETLPFEIQDNSYWIVSSGSINSNAAATLADTNFAARLISPTVLNCSRKGTLGTLSFWVTLIQVDSERSGLVP